MPFVKLDCDILKSTIWFNRNDRDVFITALLMAEPFEALEPLRQIEVDSLEETGFVVPPGWYGFVSSAGVGIAHQAQVPREDGIVALRNLGNPEADSRSQEWEGRRLVRVNGGFVVLNYMKYRERDYTASARQARYRERQRNRRNITDGDAETVTLPRNITQAEAEAEVDLREEGEAALSPPPPAQVLQTLWNNKTTQPLPLCRALSPARVKKCRVRLAEHPEDYWADVVDRIQASSFCRGQNDRGWVATFDWLIENADNAIKVLEGKYDNRLASVRHTPAAPAPDHPDDDWCDHEPRCTSRDWHAMKMQVDQEGSL